MISVTVQAIRPGRSRRVHWYIGTVTFMEPPMCGWCGRIKRAAMMYCCKSGVMTRIHFRDVTISLPAGHLPAGADYRESAVRELEEELGIAVSPEDLRFLGMHEGDVKEEFYGKPFHNHEISAIFILEKNIEPEGMCLQKEEVSGVLWMDFAECLDGIRKNTLCHCIFEDEFETLGEYLGILSKTETT